MNIDEQYEEDRKRWVVEQGGLHAEIKRLEALRMYAAGFLEGMAHRLERLHLKEAAKDCREVSGVLKKEGEGR